MDERDGVLWTYFLIYLGEFSGSAFLLYFGCMGMIKEIYPDRRLPDLQAALIWGTTVTGVIMIFGHITRGHFNPCVTLCALILRIISPFTAVVYVSAELSGATFGYWLLTITIPARFMGNYVSPNRTEGFCNTQLHPSLTIYQGLLAEFVATSFLIYAVCSAWDARNAIWSDSVALKFGFVIIAMVTCMGHFTGSSMNPARSFAPALVNGFWKDHWIYWVATSAGSIFTTFTYKFSYMHDTEDYFRSKEKLSDQFRQGSLYSKQEAIESLAPKKPDSKAKDLPRAKK